MQKPPMGLDCHFQRISSQLRRREYLVFSPVLIPEPLLEFRNGVTMRSPRRGMLSLGPYDYGKIPEVKVALLVHNKLENEFDRFWKIVDVGDPLSGFNGFTA